jgi:DNA polymerase III epsilon subunit-like protein
MKYIFLDTETTGNGEEDRLVQLAWYCEETGFSQGLFRPPLPIKYGAMGIHHITNEMVEDRPPFKGSEMYDELAGLLSNGFIIVAHNARFDVDMLRREGFVIEKYVDTLKLARKHVSPTDSHSLQALKYRLNLEQTLLDEAAAHDAAGDVAVLYELFKYLKRKVVADGIVSTQAEWERALDEYLLKSCEPSLLDVVAFGKHKGVTFKEVAKHHPDYLRWLWDQPGQKDPDLLFTLRHYLDNHGKEQPIPAIYPHSPDGLIQHRDSAC